MDTLAYLTDKYKLNLTEPSPIALPISRETDIPQIFTELGFKTGAEIGVYRGGYSEVLLKNIPGLKLYGIDLWNLYSGYRDYRKDDIHSAETEAMERTKNYDCKLIKGWSNEVSKQFADESLDFVYIDGNHSYEYTVMDLAFWSKKVRKGGIVYGHDFEDWSKNWRRFDMNVIKDKHPSWMYIK
jgi:hypothetical protein